MYFDRLQEKCSMKGEVVSPKTIPPAEGVAWHPERKQVQASFFLRVTGSGLALDC